MQKSVQITVYVVKSRTTHQDHFSGHRRRPLISSAAATGGGGGCRKAQLLLYSQQLRKIGSCQLKPSEKKTQTVNKLIKEEDVQIASSHRSQGRTNGVLKIRTNQNSHLKVAETLIQIASSNRQQPPYAKKVVPVELNKPVITKVPQQPPSCFSDWRDILLPRFIGKYFGGQNAKNDIHIKKKKLSASLSGKMNAVMMSSRMKKERIGVTAKFLSLTGKRS